MSLRIALRRALCAALLLACLSLNGCLTHHIRVGMGGNGVSTTTRTQYYMFFGLLRLNSVDVQQQVAGINSYDVTTRFGWGDLALMPFFLPLTVTTRTITIEE